MDKKFEIATYELQKVAKLPKSVLYVAEAKRSVSAYP